MWRVLDIASEEEPQSKQTVNWLKKTDRRLFWEPHFLFPNLPSFIYEKKGGIKLYPQTQPNIAPH
jgi:hypothetical protein